MNSKVLKAFKIHYLYIGVIMCSPFITFSGILDPYQSPIFLVFSLLHIVFYGYLILFRKPELYINHIYILAIVYAGIALINFLINPFSTDGIYELNRVWFFVSSWSIFNFLWHHYNRSPLGFYLAFIVAGFFFSIVAFAEYVTFYNEKDIHLGMYHVSGNLGHKNLLSIYLTSTLCFAYYMIKTHLRRILGFILSVYIIGVSILILLTMSRVGIVGLSIFLFFVMYVERYNWSTKKTLILGVFCSVLVLFSVQNTRMQNVYKRAKSIMIQSPERDQFNQSITERKVLWSKTLELIANHPMMGVGLGQWKYDIISKDINETRSKYGNIIFQQPHNDFLWVWSEIGIIALIGYLGMFIYSFYFLFQKIKNTKERPLFYYYSTLFLSLLIIFVQSQFDFPKERPLHLFIIAFLFSLVLKEQKTKKLDYRKWHIIIFIIYLVFQSASALFFLNRCILEKRIAAMLDCRTNHKTYELIEIAQEIKKGNLYNDQTSTPIDFYIGEALFQQGNIFDARDAFLSALKVNPFHLYTLSNLGGCYLILEDSKKAIAFWNQAIGLSKDFAEPRINLGLYYLKNHQYQEAYAVLKFNIESDQLLRYRKEIHEIVNLIIDYEQKNIKAPNVLADLVNVRQDTLQTNWIFNKFTKENYTFKEQIVHHINFRLEN